MKASETRLMNLRLRSILDKESFDDRAPVLSLCSFSSTGEKSKLGTEEVEADGAGVGASEASDLTLCTGFASLAEGAFGLGGRVEVNLRDERKAIPLRAEERASIMGFMAARHWTGTLGERQVSQKLQKTKLLSRNIRES